MIKTERCFAPAVVHSAASSLTLWNIILVVDSLRSKILEFLSLQIVYETSMIMERMPLLEQHGVIVLVDH